MKYFLLLSGLILSFSLHAAEIYIAPSGNDSNPGTIAQPIATLSHAQELARAASASGPVTVLLRDGTYYLPAPLVFTAVDSHSSCWPRISHTAWTNAV